MKRVLLAGILGGIVAFVWSAIAHMNPITGSMGLNTLDEKEEAVLAALKSHVPRSGLYYFPGLDMTRKLPKEQQDAWTAKHRAGPVGLLLYHAAGSEPMTPQQLLVEFGSTTLCALIAAFLLTSMVGSVRTRAANVSLLGLFCWFALSVSQWNWYGFPLSFIALDVLDQVIGWLLAGLVMARLIPPAKA